MKHIKTYENNKPKPKIGDFILMKSESHNDFISNFVNNNIGKVTNIYNNAVEVTYQNPPEVLPNHNQLFTNRKFNQSQIVDFAPTITELQIKLDLKKYNL